MLLFLMMMLMNADAVDNASSSSLFFVVSPPTVHASFVGIATLHFRDFGVGDITFVDLDFGVS